MNFLFEFHKILRSGFPDKKYYQNIRLKYRNHPKVNKKKFTALDGKLTAKKRD